MCQTFFFTLSKQDTRYTIHWEGAALESWSGGKNTNWIQIQFGYFGLWDTQPIQIYRLKRMLSSCQYDNTYEHQFSSVAQSCLTLCDPMDCSTTDFPVHQQLLELTQTHVHWVCDAIQSSHPLSSPSSPVFNLFQHQGLSQWVSSLHQVARVLQFQLQHQSFQWIFRTDFL